MREYLIIGLFWTLFAAMQQHGRRTVNGWTRFYVLNWLFWPCGVVRAVINELK